MPTSRTYLWQKTLEGGHWLNLDAPIANVTDRGFAYGDGLFETIKVRQGIPLFFGRHLQRLRAGLTQLKIPTSDMVDDDLRTGCEQTIEKNNIAEGVLKIIVTRGAGARGFAPPPDARPMWVIQVTPQQKPGFPRHQPQPGLSAILANWQVDPASPLCSLKSLSALDKVLARQWAHEQTADEALFQNFRGHLTEATAWNLFLVSQAQVFTPAQHCGLLPGIIRALLLETTTAIEAELPVEVLTRADEAFLTNSIGGVRPLVRFNGRSIGAGQPGSVTAAMAAHLERLEVDYIRRANASKKATVL